MVDKQELQRKGSYYKKPIFVLGVPRSGTSMISGALALCGDVWLGNTVPGQGPENPQGLFEHAALREQVNKQILARMGCDPTGVKSLPDLDALPDVPNLSEVIYSLLEKEGYDGSRPWLFKDAKLTLLWPVYHRAFPEAHWIIVRRAEKDIIQSCLSAFFMVQHSTDPDFWLRWIQSYLDRLDVLRRTVDNYSEIWPHSMVRGDLSPLKNLAEELGLDWNEAAVSRFILPDSWHANA